MVTLTMQECEQLPGTVFGSMGGSKPRKNSSLGLMVAVEEEERRNNIQRFSFFGKLGSPMGQAGENAFLILFGENKSYYWQS
jgi:hypothetical protein